MATATARGRASQTPVDESTVGIQPVPAALRRLRAIDVAVLWGDLAVGVLVLAAGALLVTPTDAGGLGLGLGRALLAIAIGSVAGSVLLALVALAAHDRAVPTMVLLRPVLGRYGSYGASALNVVQLIGWTAFEFWAMALFADRVSEQVFGFRAFGLWLAVVAVACTGLALLGPFGVVRAWLEKAGIWIVLAACGYLTVHLLTRTDFGTLFAPTTGSAPFGSGVDLVVALPVSWLPLVADYNRFSTGRRQNFLGTLGGYSLGNFWFYALGALLVLSAGLADPLRPDAIAGAILGVSAGVVVGTLILSALLAGETDEAFADIYSAAVSIQNLFPRLPQRALVVGIGAVGALLAAVVTMGSYEAFLLLLGSVFVPLFGVVLAEWAAGGLRREGDVDDAPTLRPLMTLAWIAGFALYHWVAPSPALPGWWTDLVTRVPGAGRFAWWGASLPSFAGAFVLALAAARWSRRRRGVT